MTIDEFIIDARRQIESVGLTVGFINKHIPSGISIVVSFYDDTSRIAIWLEWKDGIICKENYR